jgi:glyoxylase-like metal-dependent hydrolase (beta-lactamase superfamily II)
MRQIAEGLWLLTGSPWELFNVYLMGDTLVDAATRWAASRILRQLRGKTVRQVALTHVHPDHQGAAAAVCKQFDIPLACHEADVAAMEGRAPMLPDSWIVRFGTRVWAGPPHPVGRVLREGDEVGGFRVVHTPGHTPGHILFFRDSDRVAVVGDVLANFPFRGLREPPWFFSADPAENTRSVRRVAELEPALLCFGHGRPLADMRLLDRYVARLR